MENHGVLIRPPQPSEWKLGGETGIVQSDTKIDWSLYLPYPEKQNRIEKGYVIFDTLACTHFASGHIYETFVIYLWKTGKLPADAIKFFTQFLTDKNDINSFRVSKQFSAIVGGNTIQGNYFTVAWDTWRKTGAIPDSMLNTINTSNTWQEYHDKSHVTPEMLKIAEESLLYVDVMYQWLQFDGVEGFSPFEKNLIEETLKTSPLNCGIPIPANHSVQMFSETDMLNTYYPFIGPIGEKVHFALQALVKPRVEAPTKPQHTFKTDLSFGSRGVEVYWLQRCLSYEGHLNKNLINPDPTKAYFGENTRNGVKSWQKTHTEQVLKPAGLTMPTGYVGNYSRKYLNLLYSKP